MDYFQKISIFASFFKLCDASIFAFSNFFNQKNDK